MLMASMLSGGPKSSMAVEGHPTLARDRVRRCIPMSISHWPSGDHAGSSVRTVIRICLLLPCRHSRQMFSFCALDALETG